MTASKSPSEDGARRLGRVRLAGFAAALAVALLLFRVPGPDRLGDGLFDLYQRAQPRDLSAMRVQVVEIDPESLALVGPWPWSRYDMARLTERIGRAGAVAIGFDMFFAEVDRQTPALFAGRYPELPPPARDAVLALPSLDEAFATVLGRYPTVLARAGVTERSVDYGEAGHDDAAALPVDAAFAGPLPPGVAAWPRAIASIPAIEETSLGHGLVNGDPDDDGVVRRVPAVGVLHGAANVGLSVELARIALRQEAVTPVVHRGALAALRLGGRTVPLAADGRYRLHFGHVPARSITSAVNLLRQGFDDRRIAGKIVVIGVTGAGGTDIVATPLDPQAYGLHVQAQAADAMLRGGWLTRPALAPPAEFAGGAILAAIAILLFPRLRGAAATVVPLALAALVLGASFAAFVAWRVLIDPLVPLAIGGAAGLAVLVALFVEGGIAQRLLRAALLHEQLTAERAAGEMDAARDIQQGMMPVHAGLAALHPGLDIDALLEPARQVGGDFYDAFRLSDGRILFLIGDVTGKGVPAALFMALSKSLAHSVLERGGDDLAAAVTKLSDDLSRDNAQDMFVTMLIGAIDCATGVVTLVNAGHENPLILRGDGTLAEMTMDGGPPVCAAEDFPYEAETLTLAPGEGLVVVTDGVTEAQDGGGGFFDRARVSAALAGLPDGWTAADACVALRDAVRAFEAGAEPSDDLTVLALRRSPSGEGG